MDSTDTATAEIAHEFPPMFRIYKDGLVERLRDTETVPPSTDPVTGVESKDVRFSSEHDLSARLFLPPSDPSRKLPLILYFHGGAFTIQSPFSPLYTTHLASLSAAAAAAASAVSFQYRLAPEHLLPAAYDDAWAAIQWVAAQSENSNNDAEPWLHGRADFDRVFLAGDSAGANIAHSVAVRAGTEGVAGLRIVGMALIHPFFRDGTPDKLIEFIFPASAGKSDPRMEPGSDPNLERLGCQRVVVFLAEKDHLRDRGRRYLEALRASGWRGRAEVVEHEGEGHVFHLFNPGCENAAELMKRFAAFVNED